MSVAELELKEMKNRDNGPATLRQLLEKRNILETGFEEKYIVAVNGELEQDLDRTVNPSDRVLVAPKIVGG